MALQVDNKVAKLFKYQQALERAKALHKQLDMSHLRLTILARIHTLENSIKELQDVK